VWTIKYLSGKMINGIGRRKLQIGAIIGAKKKIGTCIQNMLRSTAMLEILLVV